MQESYGANADVSDIFDLKPAKEWLRNAKKIPRGALLGELWAENEIAVLFGRSGAGKSIFAVQLGDQLARGGIGPEPFSSYTSALKTVYLDLERPAEQFIKCYSPERDPETRRIMGKPYGFSHNLIRVEPKNDAKMDLGKVAGLVEATGAKVLIIDGLAYFLKYTVPREAAEVMKELRRIRKRFGVSILVTMNATRSVARRPLNLADLPCSSVIAAAADSVFAIGKCTSRHNGRYIKHLKAGSRDTPLGAEYVPYFVTEHRDGNFPSFKFIDFCEETAVIAPDGGAWERWRMKDVQRLRNEGLTIRAIAEELGMSRSAVHRRLRIADSVSR